MPSAQTLKIKRVLFPAAPSRQPSSRFSDVIPAAAGQGVQASGANPRWRPLEGLGVHLSQTYEDPTLKRKTC